VWYASFELQTSHAEVAYHRRLWLQETNWNEPEESEYLDYLADFRAEFHDLRNSTEYGECLSPTSYQASQALGARLLALGSSGIVYPSVRRAGGTCIGCFRPVLVINVRKGYLYKFTFPDLESQPTIRRA
jgi:RES domain